MATTNDSNETTTEYDEGVEAPRNASLMRRDFGGVTAIAQNGAIEALVAKERAMIEARWTMALHRPRNLDNVRQSILKECKRPGFAEVAVYERPVGRKYNDDTKQWEQQYVEGLSIRFAEVAVRCMQNILIETPTVHESDSEKLVRVMVIDFETNATWSRDLSVRKTIERKSLKKDQKAIGSRRNSYGDTVYIVEASDDEVAVKEAALISKAARTLILRLIPGHIQDEALELCKKIASDRSAVNPDAARNKIFDAFGTLAVKPAEIELYLGHSTETISPAELDKLRKLYAAINDGEISWQSALDAALDGRDKKPAAAPAGEKKDAPAAEVPSSKKGTAAVKDAIKNKKADGPKNEEKPVEKPAEKTPEQTATTAAAPASDDHPVAPEHRCKDCGVPCEPPGKCAACANS